MSTSTKRLSGDNRTPQETPAAIAREIAQLATAPVRDFVDCISDEDNTRDHLYQRLVTRLTADWRGAWSKAREDDVEERLRESLATEENVELFHRYMDHWGTKTSISQEAAFLLGVEFGRSALGDPPDVDELPPALRATVARSDCLARFEEVDEGSRQRAGRRDRAGQDERRGVMEKGGAA